MANEAVIIELLGADKGQAVRYTVADGTAITKGTIMQLSGADLTAIASAGQDDTFAGIAAADKVANDGATQIACYTEGIFDLTSCDEIPLGHTVAISGANFIVPATAESQLRGSVVGVAMEASDTANEVIRVHVGKP